MRNTSQRVIIGALCGIAATHIMDGVGTFFYNNCMAEDARRREREVEPKFPLTVLGERIAARTGMQDVEEAGERLSTAMHWGIGAVCGALHALIAPAVRIEHMLAGQPIAMVMLAIDEFGFTAANLAPPPRAFPYETHARAAIAHITYGITLALLYDGALSYLPP